MGCDTGIPKHIKLLLICLFAVTAIAVVHSPCSAGSWDGLQVADPIGRLFYEFKSLLRNIPPAVRTALLIMGTVSLIAGFAFYKFIIMVPGALIGAVAGYGIGYASWGDAGGILLGLLGMSIGGSLAWGLHQLAVFLIGAFAGVVITSSASYGLFDTAPNGIVTVIAAIIAGGMLLELAKTFVILQTSVTGAFLVMVGLRKPYSLSLLIGLTVVGVAIQSGLAAAGIKSFDEEEKGTESTTVNPGVFLKGGLVGLINMYRARGKAPHPIDSNKGDLKPISPSNQEKEAEPREEITGKPGADLSDQLDFLHSNKDRIINMVRSGHTVANLKEYFKKHHDIPEIITHKYLERLLEEEV